MGQNFTWVSIEQGDILIARARERMVFSHITLLILIPAKQREIDNPSEFEYIVIDEPKLAADFEAQVAKYVGNYLLRVGGEEQ
ncbi:hypothetical protein D3C77_591880 [compost metagenome]